MDPLFSLERAGNEPRLEETLGTLFGEDNAAEPNRGQRTGCTHHGADRAFDDHGFGRPSTGVAQAVSFQPLPIKLSAKNKSVPYTSMQEYEEIASVAS